MTNNFLKRPYPYDTAIKKDLLTNFCIGVFIAFFLIVFQPFGIAEWQTPHKLMKLLAFGGISFIVPSLINLLMYVGFDARQQEQAWMVWKEIVVLLLVLMGIALGNLWLAHVFCLVQISMFNFFLAIVVTVLIGVFPITASVLLKYNRYRQLNERTAQMMEEELVGFQQKIKPAAQEPALAKVIEATAQTLRLVAENEKDVLIITEEQLLYIESADNYSAIIYLDANFQRQKQLLRSSLKRLEEQLQRPQILRCHRSFLVNLMAVEHIDGNAQGYRLRFHLIEDTIPVSRAYGKEILSRLKLAEVPLA